MSMTVGFSRIPGLAVAKPEFTEVMGTGVDTRDDGYVKANRPGQIPIDGDEEGVKWAHRNDDGGPRWLWRT